MEKLLLPDRVTWMTTTGKRRGRPPSGGREEILRATHDLLRERGMAKLTTREVAERAGVSEGSVFYHFEDRFGLLKAVFERALGPLHLDEIDPARMTTSVRPSPECRSRSRRSSPPASTS